MICNQCDGEKPFTDFPKDSRLKTGRKPKCKFCTNLNNRENRKRKGKVKNQSKYDEIRYGDLI